MNGVHGPFAMRFLVVHQVSQAVETVDSAAESDIYGCGRADSCASSDQPHVKSEHPTSELEHDAAKSSAILISAIRVRYADGRSLPGAVEQRRAGRRSRQKAVRRNL